MRQKAEKLCTGENRFVTRVFLGTRYYESKGKCRSSKKRDITLYITDTLPSLPQQTPVHPALHVFAALQSLRTPLGSLLIEALIVSKVLTERRGKSRILRMNVSE